MSPLDRNHCESGESFVVVRKESSHGSSIIIKSEGYAILDQHHHSSSIGSIECEISSETTDTVVHDDDSDYDHNSVGIWERDGNQKTSRRKRNDREHTIDENTTSRMSRPVEMNTGESGNTGSSDVASSIIKNEGYSLDDRDSSSVSIECQISSDTTCTTVIIIDDDDDNNSNNTSNTRRRNLKQNIKRASVGVAGGTLVVLGVILSPLPIPVSFLCIGSGLHVLSSEFEGVKHAEQKLVDTVGRWCCEHNTTL
mmetsp:Transcript_28358/g.28716  ORF Transcript_28358/g.28716 Transcript_28358/m.28716 type:complete len:254 (-) Transcript_28358:229-990(-)